MILGLPVSDGKFSGHYGKSQALRLYEAKSGAAHLIGDRAFPDTGVCSASAWVAEQGVEVMLTGGLGKGAADGLMSKGIRVVAGFTTEDTDVAVQEFLAGNGTELSLGESRCQGHGDHEHEEGHVCHCHG